jgi:hypothetical protein
MSRTDLALGQTDWRGPGRGAGGSVAASALPSMLAFVAIVAAAALIAKLFGGAP